MNRPNGEVNKVVWQSTRDGKESLIYGVKIFTGCLSSVKGSGLENRRNAFLRKGSPVDILRPTTLSQNSNRPREDGSFLEHSCLAHGHWEIEIHMRKHRGEEKLQSFGISTVETLEKKNHIKPTSLAVFIFNR